MKVENIKGSEKINRCIDWIFSLLGYTFSFILTTNLFKSVEINSNHIVLTYIIIVLIIYALNKTIKPILVTLTIPITALTLGLFYPCINLFILKLTDWIMGNYFNITNIYAAFILAILLSIVNFIILEILKGLVKKVKRIG